MGESVDWTITTCMLHKSVFIKEWWGKRSEDSYNMSCLHLRGISINQSAVEPHLNTDVSVEWDSKLFAGNKLESYFQLNKVEGLEY